MIIPLPCNLYKALTPYAVTPQGRVSFALFVLRGRLFCTHQVSFMFLSGMFHEKWLPFEYLSQSGSEMYIIDVTKGPPATQRPPVRPLQSRKKRNKTPSLLQTTVLSVHTYSCHTKKKICFGFKWCHQGLSKKKRKEKKLTLFVRKTKYSYAILNLLCLGCRYAVPK